jgi:GNAT superfamily N-acetyltransferase
MRELEGRKDITSVQRLASRLWPLGWHPGGLGWALARGALGERVLLFEVGGQLVAWAAVGGHEDGELIVQADPSVPGLAEDVVRACLASVSAPVLVAEVSDQDDPLRIALLEAGFARDETEPVIGLTRAVAASPPPPARGYAIRQVRPGEEAARVEVHRAAWRPADLPWPADRSPGADPSAESSFTLDAYRAVRDTWLYAEALDLVAETEGGDLVACCIGWYEESTGCAEIEPLGVVPAHRRRGLAGALCLEVGRRVAAAGGRELFVNTGVRADYPAPGGAYLKAGFTPSRRGFLYRKTRPQSPST